MPHGGYHGYVSGLGSTGTTIGPAGMGSKPKPKPKPFSQMTNQERIDRFNKNQNKYKKQF